MSNITKDKDVWGHRYAATWKKLLSWVVCFLHSYNVQGHYYLTYCHIFNDQLRRQKAATGGA